MRSIKFSNLSISDLNAKLKGCLYCVAHNWERNLLTFQSIAKLIGHKFLSSVKTLNFMDTKLNRFTACVFLRKPNLTRMQACLTNVLNINVIEIARACLLNVLCEFKISPYLLDVQFVRPLNFYKQRNIWLDAHCL